MKSAAYTDQAAVAACARDAGLDHRHAEAAMFSADLYWLIALGLDAQAETTFTHFSQAEILETRRRHADIFGRSRRKPPSGRLLRRYLRRVAGLTPEQAQRFAVAHSDHLNAKADALLARHHNAGGRP